MVGKRNIRNYFNCSEIITFEVIEMKQAKVLTEKELKKVIDYIDAFDKHAHRNKVIVLLTHYCGMRVSEVASLVMNVLLPLCELAPTIPTRSYKRLTSCVSAFVLNRLLFCVLNK